MRLLDSSDQKESIILRELFCAPAMSEAVEQIEFVAYNVAFFIIAIGMCEPPAFHPQWHKINIFIAVIITIGELWNCY